MTSLSSIVKKFLPAKIVEIVVNFRRVYFLRYNELLYSQSGEDGILKGIFFDKINSRLRGTYVDIGCFHPYKSSNTYFFYNMRWKGINIDVNPESIYLFEKHRPDDLNINIAIWESTKNMYFYRDSKNPGMSFISDKNDSALENNTGEYKITEVKALPLSDILSTYADPGEEIDFMSIDVEGNELAVLKSNDWVKFRPKVLVVEQLGVRYKEIIDSEVFLYLEKLDYSFLTFSILSKEAYSVFYCSNEFLQASKL